MIKKIAPLAARHSRKLPLLSREISRGFTLLEVLVTLIVISIGLLSIAQLQARALQFSYASLQRTVATVQVNDLVERMWTGICDDDNFPTQIFTDWQADSETQALLPQWDADFDDDLAPIYRVTIFWSENRIEEALQSLEFSFQLIDPNIGC